MTKIKEQRMHQIYKISNNIVIKSRGKTLKQFIKPTSTSHIPPLSNQGVICSENKDKAELLNDFFCEQNTLDDNNTPVPPMTSQSDNMLNSVQFTPYEGETVLKSLKTGKASGPDSINNRILKELSQPLSHPLCDLFNFSIVTGKVPDIWKQANTPIFKKNDASDPTNYRTISPLSSIGKVLEKLVLKRIFNFFRINQVITTLQSGFVPGDSTVNQLVDIYNTFCKVGWLVVLGLTAL